MTIRPHGHPTPQRPPFKRPLRARKPATCPLCRQPVEQGAPVYFCDPQALCHPDCWEQAWAHPDEPAPHNDDPQATDYCTVCLDPFTLRDLMADRPVESLANDGHVHYRCAEHEAQRRYFGDANTLRSGQTSSWRLGDSPSGHASPLH